MAEPFLSNFFLSEDCNRDLSVGLALEALIERDKGVMKTFVASERRRCSGFRGVGESLQAFEKLGLRVEIAQIVQFEGSGEDDRVYFATPRGQTSSSQDDKTG